MPTPPKDPTPPGQAGQAQSPDSMAQHARGQASPGQPGLHGQGALPAEAPPSEGEQNQHLPVPPAGGKNPDAPGDGHTIRNPGTIGDEQRRGG